ncbi:hypothetical protein PPSQR21_032580 [Paenibacillus polymyxa SQR-21]|uniref:hypothetical protein n=1 Tax=Paenibacillus polymyxa TaxID=1406 RepID=UPI00042F58C9|nr:hypothetical protein [Paenibacillus polymyxa]AHM66897.1 hypothetical protein PPSQR21_032580 [Paenibacillus polymyxa SQR-21]
MSSAIMCEMLRTFRLHPFLRHASEFDDLTDAELRKIDELMRMVPARVPAKRVVST